MSKELIESVKALLEEIFQGRFECPPKVYQKADEVEKALRKIKGAK